MNFTVTFHKPVDCNYASEEKGRGQVLDRPTPFFESMNIDQAIKTVYECDKNTDFLKDEMVIRDCFNKGTIHGLTITLNRKNKNKLGGKYKHDYNVHNIIKQRMCKYTKHVEKKHGVQLKYALVPEYDNNGNLHYHCCFNQQYYRVMKGIADWARRNCGYCKLEYVVRDNKLWVAYCLKNYHNSEFRYIGNLQDNHSLEPEDF